MYKVAMDNAWKKLQSLSDEKSFEIGFMGDKYSVDIDSKRVLSFSCNAAVKDNISVLLLHYLISDLKGIPAPKNEWISFKNVPEGAFYYSAYRGRALFPIIRKYGENPESVLDALERLSAKQVKLADVAIQFNAFDKVPVVVCLYRKDEEFDADANILYDANIVDIFPTEDIAVLGGFIAGAI